MSQLFVRVVTPSWVDSLLSDVIMSMSCHVPIQKYLSVLYPTARSCRLNLASKSKVQHTNVKGIWGLCIRQCEEAFGEHSLIILVPHPKASRAISACLIGATSWQWLQWSLGKWWLSPSSTGRTLEVLGSRMNHWGAVKHMWAPISLARSTENWSWKIVYSELPIGN